MTLIEDIAMPEDMILFYGGVFSQWYPARFVVDGVVYNCAEQYMMAKKAQLFQDHEALTAIMASRNPATQKAIGRKVKGFNRDCRDSVSRDVVLRGSLAKFSQNPGLLAHMLKTGDAILVEASPTDTIWGIGLDECDPDALDPSKWQGTNWLGEVLMETRRALQDAAKTTWALPE